MEKEKRKGKPRKGWIIFGIITVIMTSLCWSFSYNFYPGHSLSEFSRFKSSDEVVAFLHDNFDLYVTTNDEIHVFLDTFTRAPISCGDSTPRRGDFEGYVVDEEISHIINCRIMYWHGFPGQRGYILRFYINHDDLLTYISASGFCICI